MATTFVPATGTPTANMAALQAAVNSAAPGDTLTLAAGGFYDGTLTLPPKAVSAVSITITSNASAAALPAAGTRITPSSSAFLPSLRVLSNNTAAVKTCAPSVGVANGYTLRCLEVIANAFAGGNLVEFGSADGSLAVDQDTAAKVPADLTIDRCYIHGNPYTGQKRGVALDGLRLTVQDSYISDCWGIGQDTQAIGGSNGLGTYTVTNNYLEGAGENVLFGGADPLIPSLVPTGLIFTRNDVTRPPAWRSAILSTPVASTTTTTGGTLPAASYDYRVVARRPASYQNTLARSAASAITTRAVTLGQAVVVSWAAIPGATEYYVYRAGPSGSQRFVTTATTYTDTGAAGTVEVAPTTGGTVRSVKNLLELKNWDGATIRGNRFSYHWVESQPGPSIVFTPVNQSGGNNQTIVANVLFELNTISHVAGGFNISAHDAQTTNRISQRAHHITIRHNLVTDLGSAWGSGNLRDLSLTSGSLVNTFEGADSVTVDHNTLLTSGTNACVYFSEYNATRGYPVATNFRYTNNLARRGSFGIFGSNSAEANATSSTLGCLEQYCSAPTVTKNAIVGINLSLYPAGHYNPTEAVFQAQFVDYAGGNYRLAPGTLYKNQGTDTLDLGADIDAIEAAYAGTTSVDLTINVAAAASTGTFYLETQIGCAWTAGSDAAWLTVTSAPSGTGTATITYAASANPTTAVRSGTITVGGRRVLIIQAAQTSLAVGIAVPKGTLTLTGAAPSLRRAYVTTQGRGTATLTGTIPTVVLVAPTEIVRATSLGSLTLAGAAPALARTHQQAQGALTFTGAAPTLGFQATATPGAATLTLTGRAPLAPLALARAPGVGALVFTGKVPLVVGRLTRAPGAGTLSLTPTAATILLLNARTPAAGSLVLAGAAPTLFRQATPTPSTGTLALTGAAPSTLLAWNAQPAAAALALTGMASAGITTGSVGVGTAALQLVGLAPTGQRTFVSAHATVALTLTGLAPTVLARTILLPSPGVLAFTGQSPTRVAVLTADPLTGLLALAGAAPLMAIGVSSAAGTLTLSGLAPSLTQTGERAPAVGSLTLTGLAPGLATLVALPRGTLTLAGVAPSLVVVAPTALVKSPDPAVLVLGGATLTVINLGAGPAPAALVFEGYAPTLGSCGYTVTPLQLTTDADAISLAILVTTDDPACEWAAASNDPWLSVSVNGGIGDGTFTVAVAAYDLTDATRTGTLTVAGQEVVVIQLPAACAFAVSPGSLVVPGVGLSDTISVTTTAACSWTATSAVSWITLPGLTSGTGSDDVAYTVAPNPGIGRVGSLTVAGHFIQVTQSQVPPTVPPSGDGMGVSAVGCRPVTL